MIDYILDLVNILMPILLKIAMVLVPLLISVAYLTLAERKIIGAMQLRCGPNVVGPFGLLQPIADALKLIKKELIIPDKSNKLLFLLAPVITFGLAIAGWAVVPIGDFVIADINIGVLYMLAISSLGIYGIIIAGWASNSKYAFFGAMRSAAQMISYELSIGLCLVSIIITSGSLNMREIVMAQQNNPLYIDILLFPLFIIFFISILAETNRHPFDLPEAEAELVAGYHVEYSSMAFALFFLGEYANMILMSSMAVIFFMGGWFPPFGITSLEFIPPIIWFTLKVSLCLFVFIWIRAALPRYRYDQLMRLGWKFLLPITMLWVVIISSVVVFSNL
jgi:NADH-quinone oxidoreductase subunit H